MPRIALVHATKVAIDPIEKAARLHWPEAETISILEEGLSVDRRKTRQISMPLHQRIVALTQYAERADADGVLFTCSAFGAAIEDAAAKSTVPVMKPNEAMFDAAFAFGERIAMIYTFPPAAEGMEEEFMEAARARGHNAQLSSFFCEDALCAKHDDDHATHDQLLVETAQQIENADVIMLAQFSMADAANALRKTCAIPILTSPEAAIAEMRRRVVSQAKVGIC